MRGFPKLRLSLLLNCMVLLNYKGYVYLANVVQGYPSVIGGICAILVIKCYLVCDRLPVDVKDFTRERGIEIIPIMSGSSHWFQIHDQFPFEDFKALLKSFQGFPSLLLTNLEVH